MKRILVLLSLALLFSGCSWQQHQENIDGEFSRTSQRVDDSTRAVEKANQNPLVRKQAGVWFGGKPVAVEAPKNLPAVFSPSYKTTMMVPARENISTIAERITKMTGIRVRVSPDVFISATDLNPAGSSAASSPEAAAAPPSDSNNSNANDFDTAMTVNYDHGPLSGLLDMIAARVGVSWKYENDEIMFYRFLTQTFSLKAIPGTADIKASIGKTGETATSTGNETESTGMSGTAFSSTGEAKTSMQISVWSGIENALKATMTPLGKYSISEATGTIVVTDIPQVIKQVESLIDHENRLLTRQVNLKVELIQVGLTNESQFGINWDAVYTELSKIAGDSWRLSAAGPVISMAEDVGSLGFNVLTSDLANPEKFEGSSVIFQALATVAKVHSRRVVSLTTTNNQPSPFALTNQTGYLAQIEAAAVTTDGATGSPGLTPGIVTTGFVINVTPTILDNSKILLHFTLDNSILDGIETKSSGGNSIETPIVSSEQFLQRMVLRSNETVVIAPYETTRGSYDKKTLDQDIGVGAGGSFSGRTEKTAIVILITPTLLEGA